MVEVADLGRKEGHAPPGPVKTSPKKMATMAAASFGSHVRPPPLTNF